MSLIITNHDSLINGQISQLQETVTRLNNEIIAQENTCAALDSLVQDGDAVAVACRAKCDAKTERLQSRKATTESNISQLQSRLSTSWPIDVQTKMVAMVNAGYDVQHLFNTGNIKSSFVTAIESYENNVDLSEEVKTALVGHMINTYDPANYA